MFTQVRPWILVSTCFLFFACESVRPQTNPENRYSHARNARDATRVQNHIRLGGWITYWDFDPGMKSLQQRPGALEEVFFFAVHLDPDEMPILADPSRDYDAAVKQVDAQKGRAWLTVVNDLTQPGTTPAILKDSEMLHAIFHDPDRRKTHRARLVDLAIRYGFSGVDIDYENLMAGDRDAFSAFVQEMASDLREKGLSLSVTVQPKVGESHSDGPGAMDWGKLCQSVDRLQIMLYNLHSAKTGPGPIATPAWIRSVLAFAQEECPAKRIVPVLKVAGMRWGDQKTEGVQYDQAILLAKKYRSEIMRDPNGDVPYLRYRAEEKEYTVYYEDRLSVEKKIETIRDLGIRSVLFWSLGRHDPELLTGPKSLLPR